MARGYSAARLAAVVESGSRLLGNLFPGSERVGGRRRQARLHEAKSGSEPDRRLHLGEPGCLRNYDVGIDGPSSRCGKASYNGLGCAVDFWIGQRLLNHKLARANRIADAGKAARN